MMPLYDVRCTECNTVSERYSKIEDRKDIKCEECGGDTERLVRQFNRGFVLEPQYFEHLDKKPVWIKSKKHLKEECKKRGVWAKCLD